jgi:hypothetical protein
MSKLIDKQMPIMNFDELCKDYEIETKNIYKFAPKHPSLCVLSAGTGRGKTNLLLNCLVKSMIIDKCYIFFRDDQEPKYLWLRDFFSKLNEEYNKHANKKRKLDEIFVMTNDLSKIPNLMDINKKIQNCIIFDDLVSAPVDVKNKIKILYEAGRKRNCSIFFLTQSFFGVPKGIRLNANFVTLWSTGSRKEQRELADTFATDTSYKVFERILKYACRKDRHSFLTINDHLPDVKDKFRMNLSQPIPDELFIDSSDEEEEVKMEERRVCLEE